VDKGAAAEQPVAAGRVPQYPIESVDNALKVLLLLGERDELRLTEVSEYLGVATSTAHRLLAMLQYRGFVRQDERTRSYRPGNSLTGVAFAILERYDVRGALRPQLEALNAELGETVHLGVLDDAMVRFVDAIESPKAVRVASRLGRSMPAHCTSTGKALLAQLPAAALHRLYPDEELGGLTDKSIRGRDALERALHTVRKRGYATSHEESETGVCSVAVAFPVRRGPARVAVNAAVPISRMSAGVERNIAKTLLEAVADSGPLPHA
jgi:DNA-binding IclR family transcriptional regulator